MNTLKTWINAEYGRQAALARRLGISPPSIVCWLNGTKPIPMVHAAAIEQFTQGAVTRQDMFPDSWQRIWPELATVQQQQPEGQGV